jgi:hypothetical protein
LQRLALSFTAGVPDFVGTKYQNGGKYTKLPQNIPNVHKNIPNVHKYIPNVRKIYQMAIKNTKWP